MKRVLSGVQATGNLHLGNYLGAFKPWVEWQDKAEAFYFIPNLHSLNVRPDPKQLLEDTYNNAAWLLAAGIDPKRSVIFVQSEIAAHAELSWILYNFVTMGELSRMTQYKDKSERFGDYGQIAALFNYPVLMAADILLYDTNFVPVGEDQKQHVELARDVAIRFNNLYGPVFTVPEPALDKQGNRIMNLQDPTKKMSKSDPDQLGRVNLLDSEAEIRKKIKKAVTDSGSTVAAGKDRPALTNLLNIYAALSGRELAAIEADFKGKGYGDFKASLADVVVGALLPLQQGYNKLAMERTELRHILDAGAAKAGAIADRKLGEIKEKLGLL